MHNTQNKIKKYFNAFTLVELIVVIVILAILATIAFLSFNSYSSNTRDSVRLSDINSVSKSIELYFIKVGTYPNPDNSFNVTYSGGNVWYQGSVGDNLFRKISFNINKKPIDPLNSSEYVYSLLSYGNFYQIKSNYEGDNVSFENNGDIFNFDKTLAAPGNPRIAYIKGSYMGIVAKTVSGTTICILASPSIITNISGVSGSGYEIGNNTLSGTLLYHGQSSSSGIYFNPNKPVYCSGSLPANDTNSGLTNIASGIINAYSGTVVTNLNSRIQQIVSTPSNSLSSLGSNIVGGHLGGAVASSSTSNIVIPLGSTSANPGLSCNDIKTQAPSSGSGLFWIKPDTNPAFQAYCNMSDYGGGWTLVARFVNSCYTNVRTAVGTLTSPTQATCAKLTDAMINTLASPTTGTFWGRHDPTAYPMTGPRFFKIASGEFNAASALSTLTQQCSCSPTGPWSPAYGYHSDMAGVYNHSAGWQCTGVGAYGCDASNTNGNDLFLYQHSVGIAGTFPANPHGIAGGSAGYMYVR